MMAKYRYPAVGGVEWLMKWLKKKEQDVALQHD